MANKLNCIKCKKPYMEEDDDPYYCPECNKTRLQVAKEVDAKLANRPKKNTVSELQHFDSLTKVRGFASAKDLGL